MWQDSKNKRKTSKTKTDLTSICNPKLTKKQNARKNWKTINWQKTEKNIKMRTWMIYYYYFLKKAKVSFKNLFIEG